MEEKRDVEKALAMSLKELAVKMPFEKITIKNITDGAGVIRVTFYNHFQDKYDLLEAIIREEILEPVRILLMNGMYREALILIFSNLLKDKDFYMHVSRIEGQNSFKEIVSHSIYQLLYAIFRERAGKKKPKHKWLTPEYLALYYAESMTFVVVSWIQGGMPFSPEEMAELYQYIGTRSMMDVLDELGK
ncbi:MAG: TetR/AcrR family transcriptional regulator C-terminal domain-containing protein [Lachnospiraceae bacterium]|nr:TetR/AcrR family transcriptional regulator C-terminal domain-containing protein [Lachnospiraceae bacterium]